MGGNQIQVIAKSTNCPRLEGQSIVNPKPLWSGYNAVISNRQDTKEYHSTKEDLLYLILRMIIFIRQA